MLFELIFCAFVLCAITAQLTVIISDQDEGSAGFSLSGVPVVWNLRAKVYFCNEELIELQHLVINNGEVRKCWLAGWCKDKVIDCVHHISATRLCIERCKQDAWMWAHSWNQFLKILRVTWALPKTVSPKISGLTARSMVASKANPKICRRHAVKQVYSGNQQIELVCQMGKLHNAGSFG